MCSCTIAAIPETCKPVNGADATGGTVAAPIWAAYMRIATAGMPIESFPVAVDPPDEVINSPAPIPTVQPSPDKTKDPDDDDDRRASTARPGADRARARARADAHTGARAHGRSIADGRRPAPLAEERVVDLRPIPTDTCRCDSVG